MIGGGPIAYTPIAGDEDETPVEVTPVEVTYNPISRIMSGGTNVTPANVPTLIYAWTWEDGTAITWEDGTPITLETL